MQEESFTTDEESFITYEDSFSTMLRDAEWWDVKFFHKNEILPEDIWFIEDYEGDVLKSQGNLIRSCTTPVCFEDMRRWKLLKLIQRQAQMWMLQENKFMLYVSQVPGRVSTSQ